MVEIFMHSDGIRLFQSNYLYLRRILNSSSNGRISCLFEIYSDLFTIFIQRGLDTIIVEIVFSVERCIF